MKVSLTLLAVIIAGVSAARYTGPTNEAGLNLIKEFEGWHPNFYTDPTGGNTIGYGHACRDWNCSLPLNGLYYPPLTEAQGEALLQSDLRDGGHESCVNFANDYSDLNADQWSALVSFVFDQGCDRLQISSLIGFLNAGDLAGAADRLLLYVYDGGVLDPELVRRREAERQLFCSSGACDSKGTCVGSVTAPSVSVYNVPTTGSFIVGSLSQGDKITLRGRTTGASINGNIYWFELANGFVAADYLDIATNSGDLWCSTN